MNRLSTISDINDENLDFIINKLSNNDNKFINFYSNKAININTNII